VVTACSREFPTISIGHDMNASLIKHFIRFLILLYATGFHNFLSYIIRE